MFEASNKIDYKSLVVFVPLKFLKMLTDSMTAIITVANRVQNYFPSVLTEATMNDHSG